MLRSYTGPILDLELKSWKKALHVETADGDDFPIEKARLGSIFISTTITAVLLVGYGWALERKVVCHFSPCAVVLLTIASTLVGSCSCSDAGYYGDDTRADFHGDYKFEYIVELCS